MHSLYSFLVKNLTIPRVKDLVHKPQTQYENILKSITDNDNRKEGMEKGNKKKNVDFDMNPATSTNLSDNQIEMKNELKSYINDLKSSRKHNNKKMQGGGGASSSSSSVYDNYDSYNDDYQQADHSMETMEPMSASSGGNFDQMMSLSQF